MNYLKHLTVEPFLKIIEKRLKEYRLAILGKESSSSRGAQMAISQHAIMLKIRTIISKLNLGGSDLWGYGINSICDGNKIYSSPDVEDVKKIDELNKHQAKYRFFWLLIFRIKNGALFLSIFCIDPTMVRVNSDLNTKFNLKDLDNARIRHREQKKYVDIIIKGVEKPIHFQIDTYTQGGALGDNALADYYVDKLNELAQQEKELKLEPDNKEYDLDEIESKLNDLEIKLRKLVVDTLIENTGKEDFQDLVTGKYKQDLRFRIKQHIEKHPNLKIEHFKSFQKAVQFSDIDHLKNLINSNAYWVLFETTFKSRKYVDKYFDQLAAVRHVLKHKREMTNLLLYEGQAAIEWLNMCLS